MAIESLQPIPQEEAPRNFGSSEEDFRVYQRLAELMRSGKHGERWEIRDFSPDPDEARRLDPFGVLQLDKAFVPIRAEGQERFAPFEEFAPFLILPGSIERFENAYTEVVEQPDVAEHLRSGGSVAFVVGPHKSYADLPVSASIAAHTSLETAQNQTVFIHRQVALQKIGQLLVVDDGMLRTGNILQTFPESKSGTDQEFADIRDRSNILAMKKFLRLVRQGGQTFWLNESGSEAMPAINPQTGENEMVAGRAGAGSAGLLHFANKRGTDRLLTIPYVMDIDPFKPGGGFEPHEVPFVFLEPRFIHSDEEVHSMMEEIIEVHNRIKRPETPAARYETAEEYGQRMSADLDN